MKQDWNDFGNGMKSPSGKAPARVSASILGQVHADLNPSFARVLAKLGVIHAVVSIGTLSVCPQFGLRLFGEGMGLMHWFMGLGPLGCAAVCGTFFVGSSFALSALLLTRPEWRAIRNQRVLTVTALVLLSLGAFRMMNAEFFLEASVAWLAGALLAGGLILEGVWHLRYGRELARAEA